MTRMFEGLKSWNPYFGCKHDCPYCWAKRKLAHRMGGRFKCQMCYDFYPHLHEQRMDRIPSHPRIFVGAHCDLFGDWVPSSIIEMVLSACHEISRDLWFFETKNPYRYLSRLDSFPDHTWLSTTIETNRTYPTDIRGRTLTPRLRFQAMQAVKESCDMPIHVSIEPILDFDYQPLISWMEALGPVKVAVGYDSLNNGLPEPPTEKTLRLIDGLEEFTEVERKQLPE